MNFSQALSSLPLFSCNIRSIHLIVLFIQFFVKGVFSSYFVMLQYIYQLCTKKKSSTTDFGKGKETTRKFHICDENCMFSVITSGNIKWWQSRNKKLHKIKQIYCPNIYTNVFFFASSVILLFRLIVIQYSIIFLPVILCIHFFFQMSHICE